MRKQNDFKVPEISDNKKIGIILEKQIQKKKKKKNKRKMIQKAGNSRQKKLKQLASESATAVNELKESTKVLEKTTKSLKKIIDVDYVKLANEQAEIRCLIEEVRQQHKKMEAMLKMLDEENEQIKKENNNLKKSKCKNKTTLNPLSYKKQIRKQDNTSTTDQTSKTSANDITAMVKLGSFQSNKTVASNSKLVKNKAASENSNEVETIKPH